MDSTCDHLTGQCVCLPNVEGGRCEQCSTGFYGFNSGTGCTLCNCNLEGSMNGQCHPETGQCSCKPGVTGHLCDQCITGFFGFSQDGCQGKTKAATNECQRKLCGSLVKLIICLCTLEYMFCPNTIL